MKERDIEIVSEADGMRLIGYAWEPAAPPRAVTVISHGLAEHIARYRRFAEALTGAGYLVFGLDQRGHGRSIPADTEPGDFGEPGWGGLHLDLVTLVRKVRQDHAGLPAILFGHSMGSFAAQHFCFKHSGLIDALVLSGSSSLDLMAGAFEAALEAGEGMDLADFNAPFEPARTEYDWLSRDPSEVDAYVADPLCGFQMPPAALASAQRMAEAFAAPGALDDIRPDLPVLSVAGDADPVNAGLEMLKHLENRWRGAGITRFDTHYYEGGRHELLNETNRDDVTADILAWIDGIVAEAAKA